MTDRWERLTDLYHAAVALSGHERTLLIAEECGGDPDLQADLERLIAAHVRANPTAEQRAIPDPEREIEPEADEGGTLERCGPYVLHAAIGHGRHWTAFRASRADAGNAARFIVTLITGPAERVGPLLGAVRAAHDILDPREHPNVARLGDTGVSDEGQAWVVSEPLVGTPILAFADERRLSLAQRLQLFVQVCNAIAFAHRHRVIHGSLTPAHVLVTHDGEPRLLGFGLADRDAASADDLYALGVLMGALVVGDATTGSPRQLPGALETVLQVALRHDDRRRYGSAEELADDVRRYLDSPTARPRADVKPRRGTTAGLPMRPLLAWTIAAIAVATLGVRLAPLVPRPAARTAPPVSSTTVDHAPVVLTGVTSTTATPELASLLDDALRIGLTESPFVVVGPNRRRGATEIAATIDTAVGGGFALTARLAGTAVGTAPVLLRETASDSTDLLPALARLAARVRTRLGEPAATMAATPALDAVTTPSLTALRLYARGSTALDAGDRTAALGSLKAAVTSDTGFASAYRLMAVAYAALGDRQRSADALEHAIANQERLPFGTRHHTVASHALAVANYPVAIDAYNRLLERNPRDVRALDGLGRAHAARREYAVQESLLVRAGDLAPGEPSFLANLALAQLNQGRYDDAARTLGQSERRFPTLRMNDIIAVALPSSALDWQTAEREASRRFASADGDTAVALEGLETLAGVRMTQGRIAEAERDLRRLVAAGTRRGAMTRALSAAVRLGYLELRYRRAPGAAIRTMNGALARYPLARLPEEERPYDEIARLYADAGQPARAMALIAEASKSRWGRSRAADPNRRWTLGVIASAEGRAWEGEIEIRGAAESHPCPICALPHLARAYEVAGKPDSAIATYERYLHTPWQRRFDTDAVDLGFALERLGALYQQQREQAKAAEQYSALLQLWRGADAELEPVLTDVRRRLEQTGITQR